MVSAELTPDAAEEGPSLGIDWGRFVLAGVVGGLGWFIGYYGFIWILGRFRMRAENVVAFNQTVSDWWLLILLIGPVLGAIGAVLVYRAPAPWVHWLIVGLPVAIGGFLYDWYNHLSYLRSGTEIGMRPVGYWAYESVAYLLIVLFLGLLRSRRR